MQKWTEERLLEALKLRQQGMTFADIAERMDGNPGTLHTKLARRGMITTNNRKAVAKWDAQVIKRAHERCVLGETVDDVALSMGISIRALKTQFHKHGLLVTRSYRPTWSKKTLAGFMDRINGGESVPAVAASLGVSRTQLYRALLNAGYSTRAAFVRRVSLDVEGRRIFALRREGLPYDVICDQLNLWPGDPRRTNKAVQCLSRYCDRHHIKRPRDPKRPATVTRVRTAPYALEQAEAWVRSVDTGATTIVAIANTEGLTYSCVWNAVTRARRRLRRL